MQNKFVKAQPPSQCCLQLEMKKASIRCCIWGDILWDPIQSHKFFVSVFFKLLGFVSPQYNLTAQIFARVFRYQDMVLLPGLNPWRAFAKTLS